MAETALPQPGWSEKSSPGRRNPSGGGRMRLGSEPRDIWGDEVSNSGSSKRKGPEAGTCLLCSKNF